MKEELERKLHMMRAIRVFAADAVKVGDLPSADDVTYWEGVRDGLTLAMALFRDLEECQEELRHQ